MKVCLHVGQICIAGMLPEGRSGTAAGVSELAACGDSRPIAVVRRSSRLESVSHSASSRSESRC